MLLTSSLVYDLLLLFVTISISAYLYATRKFDYWKKRGVFHRKPLPFFGNAKDLFFFKRTIAEWLKDLYDSTNEPYFGIYVFDEPHLVIKSPQLVKQILVKDFGNFADRTIATPKHNELIANMLFVQKGSEWKSMRTKMTPIFTSGKLKNMFHLMVNVSDELVKYLEKNNGPLEAKELCAKYSTDVISKCAFGINAHCFDDEDAAFRKIGRAMFEFSFRNGFSQTAYFFMQNLVNLFGINFWESWIQDFFVTAFWKTMRQREVNPGKKTGDVIDTLKEIMRNEEFCKDFKFEGDKVASQATQFFAAGFETTSSTIAFTLYELCLNRNVQDKLRAEILANIKQNNGISYESLMQMKYLDMCIMETLRKYPVLAFLDRRCNNTYKLPGTDLVLEKGLPVYIPMFGLHLDKKYFPEPEKYKPERFQENINAKVNGLVYIPFGEGPRICIGERFGMLGSKLALARIISNFEVDRCHATPVPIEFEPKSFILQSKVGLPMNFKRHVPSPA